MFTLITSLALSTGAAQAQEREWDLVHDLRCTDTQVNMTVVVTPRGDPGPENILYRDGTVEETHCSGGWDLIYPNQPERVRQELEAQCTSDGLDAALCGALAGQIVDQMVAMTHVPPLEDIFVEGIVVDPDRGSRSVFTLVFGDDTTQTWRGFWSSEGHFRTRNRDQGFEATEGTALQCEQRSRSFGHGSLTTGEAHVEFQDEVYWRCTDADEKLDIRVNLVFKNRAVDAS